MFRRATILAISAGSMLVGCSVEQDEIRDETTQETIDNLIQAGFPADDIPVVGEDVYVGRDALVTLEASREMIEPLDTPERQYRTNNLVGSGIQTICISPSSGFTGSFITSDIAVVLGRIRLGHKLVNLSPDNLFRTITKNSLRSGIEQNNTTSPVDGNHRVLSSSDKTA